MDRYVRFFEAKDTYFLLESVYVSAYADLNCCSIRKNGLVTVLFMDFDSEKYATLGHSLVFDKNRFDSYAMDFLSFLDGADDECKNAISKNNQLTFIKIFISFLEYYRWTESFYTDLAYKESQLLNDTNILHNLRELEILKNRARIFLNSYFNGSNSYVYQMALKNDGEKNFLNLSLQDMENNRFDSSGSEYDLKVSNHILIRQNQLLDSNSTEYKSVENWVDVNFNVRNTTINGICASSGNVTGEAYVLTANFTNYDILDELIDKMPQGTILISETTSPDLVTACHKALAIVTNQGGLGSHAAIISRELKIPCVVGTKNATHLIKSGDILTVYASEGRVVIHA